MEIALHSWVDWLGNLFEIYGCNEITGAKIECSLVW
jgi:hypothetical protein